ncbi:MAG TPA: ABC transporter permease [Propionibacterium sp.]|jgi:peptide/nickel transport system permease protein|nr:ABC transporter permease [Propionibacterium sp.]
MSQTSHVPPAASEEPQETAPRESRGTRVRNALRDSPTLTVGLILVGLHIIIALLAPLITSYDPTVSQPSQALYGVSAEHWLGTDQYGRDVLTRTIWGGRYALLVAFLATTVAVALGTLIGVITAYLRGWFDMVVMRIVDAMLSVPTILSLLVIVTVFGNGLPVIVLAVTIIYTPAVTRVVRGAASTVVTLDFVTAARARGEGTFSIVFREVLPSIPGVILVEYAMRASWVILLVSTLSFLGFGANPPTPDWGLMISEGRTALTVVPLATIAPIVALATLVIGMSALADGLSGLLGVDRLQRGAS